LVDNSGTASCLPAGNVPIGAPCAGLLNECVAPGVCAQLEAELRCYEFCDAMFAGAPCSLPGEVCTPLGINNLGICF